MTKPQVGEQMARRRDALRLTMRAAAKLGGLSATAWSDLEAGKQPPSATTQRAVAKALGWGFDWMDYAQRGESPPLTQPDEVAALRQRVEELAQDVARLTAAVQTLGGVVVQASAPTRQVAGR